MTVSHGIDRTGATNVAGTQAMTTSLNALVDPNADRIVFWDDSADDLQWLSLGSGLQIAATSLSVSADVVMQTFIDAKGDLLVGATDNTIARLAVGTNDHILIADSTQPNGVKWGVASAVFQRDVQDNTTAFTVSNGLKGYVITCSSNFTITFDALSTFASNFVITIVNRGTGTVTLDGNGTETFLVPGANQSGNITMSLPYSGATEGPYNVSAVTLAKRTDASGWFVVDVRETHGEQKFITVPTTVTITNASPGVVTQTGHVYSNGQVVVLSTTGALPSNLVAGTTYYVVNQNTNTYELSATVGGASINTGSAGSGTHTATPQWVCPAGVTTAWATGIGGGGGGGGVRAHATTIAGAASGGGGASGDQAHRTRVVVVPGTAYTITIGAAGAAGATAGGNGGTGGTTSFGGLLSLSGGGGGSGAIITVSTDGIVIGNGGTSTSGNDGGTGSGEYAVAGAQFNIVGGYGASGFGGGTRPANRNAVNGANSGNDAPANSGAGGSGAAAIDQSTTTDQDAAGGAGGSGFLIIKW